MLKKLHLKKFDYINEQISNRRKAGENLKLIKCSKQENAMKFIGKDYLRILDLKIYNLRQSIDMLKLFLDKIMNGNFES